MSQVVLRGGRVLTGAGVAHLDVAVADDSIVAVVPTTGSRPGEGRVVELEGRLVTPAFVDAHVHLAQTGFARLGADLSGASSLAEALDRLAAHARTSRLSVLMAYGWDETGWPEGRPPTRSEVDRAVGERPAYVARVDVHSALASTTLLDRVDGAGVTALDGFHADGPLTRDAHHAVRGAVQRLLPSSDREAAIRAALAAAATAGIGLLDEIGAPHISPASDFDLLGSIGEEAGARRVPRTRWYWGDLDVQRARGLGCAGAAGDLCVDGALGSRTAALREPYADATTSGHLYLSAEQVAAHVTECTRWGLQAGFHVIGDRAVDAVVEGFTAAAAQVGRDAVRSARHRLEHLEMVTPDQLRVLADLAVTASVQPMFEGRWGGAEGMYAARLGADRARPMNPYASMHRAGVPLAFGSDTPVTPFDPWGAVRAAVTHHTTEERLDAMTAIEAHTVGGWRAGRDDHGGRIAPGAPAYLAVWDTDDRANDGLPALTEGSALPTCVLTLVAGRVAHDPAGLLS